MRAGVCVCACVQVCVIHMRRLYVVNIFAGVYFATGFANNAVIIRYVDIERMQTKLSTNVIGALLWSSEIVISPTVVFSNNMFRIPLE